MWYGNVEKFILSPLNVTIQPQKLPPLIIVIKVYVPLIVLTKQLHNPWMWSVPSFNLAAMIGGYRLNTYFMLAKWLLIFQMMLFYIRRRKYFITLMCGGSLGAVLYSSCDSENDYSGASKSRYYYVDFICDNSFIKGVVLFSLTESDRTSNFPLCILTYCVAFVTWYPWLSPQKWSAALFSWLLTAVYDYLTIINRGMFAL